MKNSLHTFLAPLVSGVIATTLWATPATAALPVPACDALSAQHLELGESYYAPTDNTYTEGEASALATRVLDTLTHRSLRYGSGHRETCVGTGSSARAVVAEFDLEQLEFRKALAGFGILAAFEDRRIIEKRSSDRRSGDSLASVRIALPHASEWASSEDGRSVVSSRRFYREASPSVSGGSVLVQIDLSARLAGNNGVELQETTYVNGHRSDHVSWQLTR